MSKNGVTLKTRLGVVQCHDTIQRQIPGLILSRIWSVVWRRVQWPWVTFNLDLKVTIDALDVLRAQLTRDPFVIADFLVVSVRTSSNFHQFYYFLVGRWQSVWNFMIYRVIQKKVAPYKLLTIFLLRLRLFAWNFENLLAVDIHIFLSLLVDLSSYFIKWR